MGLSIGRRFDLSTRDPEKRTQREGWLAGRSEGREDLRLTFDLLHTSADTLKSNASVTSENEIGLERVYRHE
jgi:hypothetical protein